MGEGQGTDGVYAVVRQRMKISYAESFGKAKVSTYSEQPTETGEKASRKIWAVH
jgi:hypothetical protein